MAGDVNSLNLLIVVFCFFVVVFCWIYKIRVLKLFDLKFGWVLRGAKVVIEHQNLLHQGLWNPTLSRDMLLCTQTYCIYTKYSEWQVWANGPDQMPQKAVSDQGMHCKPLIQHFSDKNRLSDWCSNFRTTVVRRFVWILTVNAVIDAFCNDFYSKFLACEERESTGCGIRWGRSA